MSSTWQDGGMAQLATPGKGSDDGRHQLPLSSERSIVASVRAGQPVRRRKMIITAGPEAARSFLSSGKEGKSLAPIQQVDRGGEIAGPLPTWSGSLLQNFPLDFLEDPIVLCGEHLPKLQK